LKGGTNRGPGCAKIDHAAQKSRKTSVPVYGEAGVFQPVKDRHG
jgi:hypothetical protein